MSAGVSDATLRLLNQLGEVLPRRRRVLIIPHNYPDPDALASAAAMHLLLAQRFGVNSQIAFTGQVSRPENKELLGQLRFRWHRMEDLRSPRGTVPCILVDTAPWSRNVTVPSFARPVAVIDHHRHTLSRRRAGMVLDIRTGAGATTTITYEYLKAAGIPVPRWLAGIMAYAIASETVDLSHDADSTDMAAYAELIGRADLRLIGKVRHARLPRDYFQHLREAIAHGRKLGDLLWTHLGRVGQPEILAVVADLLLRMEGIRWSFVTAFMNGGLFLSMRSSVRRAHCSRLLQAVVGRAGSAGGHSRMAAGYLSMEELSAWDREERRLEIERTLIRRILRRRADELPDPAASSEPLVVTPSA